MRYLTIILDGGTNYYEDWKGGSGGIPLNAEGPFARFLPLLLSVRASYCSWPHFCGSKHIPAIDCSCFRDPRADTDKNETRSRREDVRSLINGAQPSTKSSRMGAAVREYQEIAPLQRRPSVGGGRFQKLPASALANTPDPIQQRRSGSFPAFPTTL